MTSTDIESVKDALAKLGKWAVEIDQIELSKVCAKSLAVIEDLRKDRERLEWMAKNGCYVTWLPNCDEFSLMDVAGERDEVLGRAYREAIDEAMTKRGEG